MLSALSKHPAAPAPAAHTWLPVPGQDTTGAEPKAVFRSEPGAAWHPLPRPAAQQHPVPWERGSFLTWDHFRTVNPGGHHATPLPFHQPVVLCMAGSSPGPPALLIQILTFKQGTMGFVPCFSAPWRSISPLEIKRYYYLAQLKKREQSQIAINLKDSAALSSHFGFP